jgi:hypothetical protein
LEPVVTGGALKMGWLQQAPGIDEGVTYADV